MGTNFYCKHIITQIEHNELEEKLAKRQYEEVKKLINAYEQPYHIGKRSCGWQFFFQANDYTEQHGEYHVVDKEALVPWDANEQSIKTYLSRNDVRIYDEYGNEYTFDEFWNNEIKDCLYRDETHINILDYFEKHKDRKKYGDHMNEFENDGLRWTTNWFV